MEHALKKNNENVAYITWIVDMLHLFHTNLLHLAFTLDDGALLGKDKANVKKKDSTLARFLNELLGLPNGELIL